MTAFAKMTFPHGSGTQSVTITPDEWLWFARSLNHEGAPLEGNAWTMIQRFAFRYPLQTKFGDFVRAFSQPVNPKFYPGGELYNKQLAEHPERRADIERRGQKRLRIASEGWNEISPRVKEVLAKIQSNQLPSPIPGSIDFAAVEDPPAHARAKGLVLLAANSGQNAFFGAGGGRSSSGYSSQTITFRSVFTWVFAAIAAAAVGLGFMVYRRVSRA